MVLIDLSPNKLPELAVDCAIFAEAPPKIDAAVFVGDETLAPNEADPKRPVFAKN